MGSSMENMHTDVRVERVKSIAIRSTRYTIRI